MTDEIGQENMANYMRYSNKVGFNVGLIFPSAKITNPPKTLLDKNKRASHSLPKVLKTNGSAPEENSYYWNKNSYQKE